MERPKSDQNKEFEIIVREFISREYEYMHGHFTLYGRNGQRQYGCDVKDQTGKLIVQCKCYENNSAGQKRLISEACSDYAKACQHFSNIEQFVVCTTLNNDSSTEDEIRKNIEDSEKHVPIDIYFWDSIEKSLEDSYTANKQYADEFEKPLFLHKDNPKVCLKNLFVPQQYTIPSRDAQKRKKDACDKLFHRIGAFVSHDSANLLIIEGDAGCGKTSLVQALCYIDRNDSEFAPKIFGGRPLVAIKLRDLDKKKISADEGMMPALFEYMGLSNIRRSDRIGELNRRFPNAVLILDGFDELCIIDGLEDYEQLLYHLCRERLDNWKIIIFTRPQYIHKNINIPSEFIALEHFCYSKREEWIRNYTDPEKCNCSLDTGLASFIMRNGDGVCDTPLTLYLIAGGGVNPSDLNNLWLLYHHIFGREIVERKYDTKDHPGSRYALLSYKLAERIAHAIYLSGNEKLYVSGNDLTKIALDSCDVDVKEIRALVEHCLGLSCYWKISNERGIAEFYHNNIRDFFLSEMIWRSVNDIYIDKNMSRDGKINSIIAFFRDSLRKAPLEERVCEFLRLRSEHSEKNGLNEFPKMENEMKLLPEVFERLISDGRSYNDFNERLLLPTIANVLSSIAQVYRSTHSPYNNKALLCWWKDNSVVSAALLFRIFYRKVFMYKGKVDLSFSEFNGYDFSNYNLREAELAGSHFINAKFVGADLSKANFDEANLQKADFKDANIKGASFSNSNCKDAIFTNASFSFGTNGEMQIKQINKSRS